MIAQGNYAHERKRKRRPYVALPVRPIESRPIAINTTAPERRPTLIEPQPIEMNTVTPEPRPIVPPFEQQPRKWGAMDEIGRLGEVAANRRSAPVEDVPRWKAALMGVLASLGHVNDRPLAQGESALARIAGAAAGGGAVGLALPGIEGQRRKDVHVAQAEQDYQRAIEAQKQVVGIETDQVMNRRREAEIPYIKGRADLERDKLESLDTHRDESRDMRRDANESLNDYRNRVLGDRRAANESLEAYRERITELRERGLTERERHNQATEALGAGNLGVRQESNAIRRESPTAAPARRDNAAAQRLLNSARSLRTRAANSRIDPSAAAALNEQADALEADAQNQYPDAVEQEPVAAGQGLMGRAGTPKPNLRVRGASRAPQGARPKFAEAQIRAAAVAKGLDPEIAVERARIRKQL